MTAANRDIIRSVAQIWESGHCSRLGVRFEGEHYAVFSPVNAPEWSLYVPTGFVVGFEWLLRIVTKRGADH